MTLLILDGPHKSTYVPLIKDYIFKGSIFNDPKMQAAHCKIILDHNLNWKINSLQKNKIRVGSQEVSSVSLLLGLVFNIGGTGFKVVDRILPSLQNWEIFSADFLDKLEIKNKLSERFFFFLNPIQITFIQGPQSDEIYTISYGPRLMGYNQLDLNIRDSIVPNEYLKFTQNGDQVLIEDLVSKEVHVLNETLKISFGSNIIEITQLK
jgi:hypothetical protein